MDVYILHCGGDPMLPDGYGGFECPVCGSSDPQRRHGGWADPAPPASWWTDTSPEAQRRRAYKRHHGDGGVKGQVYERNVMIVVLWANGARQVTLTPAFGLKSQGHVSRICNDPRWRDATELPTVEPEVLGFLRDFGVNIPAVFTKGKCLSVWMGLGLLVLSNGEDVSPPRPLNARVSEKSRLPRIQVPIPTTVGGNLLIVSGFQ